jgi:SAM-dependent methyltransferase
MLTRIREWAARLDHQHRTLILERAYIYGGTSVFGPFFAHTQSTIVDCVISSAESRFGFNKRLVEGTDVIWWEPDAVAPIDALPVESGSIDWLTCPNVVHHVHNQDGMFAEWARVLKPGGRAFVFEALVRELHQVPDDYVRYTPYGFEDQLRKAGLTLSSWTPASGVFDVIRYVWEQALDFFPDAKRSEIQGWFEREHLPLLKSWEREFPTNLKNPAKSFPTAFLFEIVKPE